MLLLIINCLGPNDHTISQIKDAVRDGLRAVKNVVEDEAVTLVSFRKIDPLNKTSVVCFCTAIMFQGSMYYDEPLLAFPVN